MREILLFTILIFSFNTYSDTVFDYVQPIDPPANPDSEEVKRYICYWKSSGEIISELDQPQECKKHYALAEPVIQESLRDTSTFRETIESTFPYGTHEAGATILKCTRSNTTSSWRCEYYNKYFTFGYTLIKSENQDLSGECPETHTGKHNNLGKLKCYENAELQRASNSHFCNSNSFIPNAHPYGQYCATDPSTGAMCAYSNNASGQGLRSTYEINCFEEQLQSPQEIDAHVPEGKACQTMSNGQLACVESPESSCPGGQCKTNCGYVNDQFLCIEPNQDDDEIPDKFDDDIDNDGIPNETDPDIDNDGILNENDNTPEGSSGLVVSGGQHFSNDQYQKLDNTLNQLIEAAGRVGSGTGTGDGDGEGDEPKTTTMPDFEGGEYSTYSEVNEAFYNRMTSSDLVTSFNNFKNIVSVGTGSCSPLTIDLSNTIIGVNLSSNFICEYWPNISSVIGPIAIAMYLFLGFRIFVSA